MIYYRDGKWQAFNRLTRETMVKPVYPRLSEYDGDISAWYKATYRYVSAMKLWNAFVEACPPAIAWQRPKLTHATEKGVPVPGIRSGGRRKYKNGAGVSANSRILSHHYRDEGERGQAHRREIKRKERAMWLREAQEELSGEYDAYSVSAWYGSVYGVEDTDAYDWDTVECEYCNGPCEL